jgi:hypothetical protein
MDYMLAHLSSATTAQSSHDDRLAVNIGLYPVVIQAQALVKIAKGLGSP